MSARGSPSTTMRSASLPVSIEPRSEARPSLSAAAVEHEVRHETVEPRVVVRVLLLVVVELAPRPAVGDEERGRVIGLRAGQELDDVAVEGDGQGVLEGGETVEGHAEVGGELA